MDLMRARFITDGGWEFCITADPEEVGRWLFKYYNPQRHSNLTVHPSIPVTK